MERLVVAVPELLRLVELEVELPVLRCVRSFWTSMLRLGAVLAERLIEEPEDRLMEELAERLVEEPVDRLTEELVERLMEEPEERPIEEPEERLIEEDPRVVVCEEDDRDAEEEPPERRVWASASGAAIIAIVMNIAAMELIILLMALSFYRLTI